MRGYEVEDLLRYEAELLDYVRQNHEDILSAIRGSGKLESDVEAKLIAALDEFAGVFQPSSSGSEAA